MTAFITVLQITNVTKKKPFWDILGKYDTQIISFKYDVYVFKRQVNANGGRGNIQCFGNKDNKR